MAGAIWQHLVGRSCNGTNGLDKQAMRWDDGNQISTADLREVVPILTITGSYDADQPGCRSARPVSPGSPSLRLQRSPCRRIDVTTRGGL